MDTDNIKIAEWLGWTDVHISQQNDCMYAKMESTDSNRYRVNGDFTLLDSHAIALLPALVTKDYFPLLERKYDDMWHLELWERIEVSPKHYESGLAFFGVGKTIHEAICEVVLKIIRNSTE